MTTKGIIFSAPMVRALLDGRKTQTRRLLRNPEYYGCPTGDCPHEKQAECDAAMVAIPKPYAPGDRLYVREASWICPIGWTDSPQNPMGPFRQEVAYVATDRSGYTADAAKDYNLRQRPSIHMPRWASRLWLAVTEVRVQRLQDIGEADAVAEGIDDAATKHFGSPVKAYAALWNSLHGAENDHSWEANPWIVAVSFTVHRGNVDQVTP